MKRILIFPARVTNYLSAAEHRGLKLLLLVLIFTTALYTKNYHGPHQSLIANHIGGILYILIMSLLISLFRPHMKYWGPVIIAFSFISILEVIQYFRIPFMLELTKNKTFALLFGISYNPVDFLFYAGGALVSFLLLFLLRIEK